MGVLQNASGCSVLHTIFIASGLVEDHDQPNQPANKQINIMAIKLQNQKLKILGARQASIFHAQAPQNLKHKNGLSHVWLPDRLLGPYHGLANLRLHMLLMGRVLAFLAAETTAAQF